MSAVRLLAGCRIVVPACLLVLALSLSVEAKSARRQGAVEQTVVVAHVGATKCCPRDICYRHHKGCVCFDPCKTTPLVLQVKDPCACCLVEVPVCMPTCCSGDPKVCCHKGFMHRQVVEYSWDCGFSLKVVFDRKGDIVVHYYGL